MLAITPSPSTTSTKIALYAATSKKNATTLTGGRVCGRRSTWLRRYRKARAVHGVLHGGPLRTRRFALQRLDDTTTIAIVDRLGLERDAGRSH
jgi:hypothetical protein